MIDVSSRQQRICVEQPVRRMANTKKKVSLSFTPGSKPPNLCDPLRISYARGLSELALSSSKLGDAFVTASSAQTKEFLLRRLHLVTVSYRRVVMLDLPLSMQHRAIQHASHFEHEAVHLPFAALFQFNVKSLTVSDADLAVLGLDTLSLISAPSHAIHSVRPMNAAARKAGRRRGSRKHSTKRALMRKA